MKRSPVLLFYVTEGETEAYRQGLACPGSARQLGLEPDSLPRPSGPLQRGESPAGQHRTPVSPRGPCLGQQYKDLGEILADTQGRQGSHSKTLGTPLLSPRNLFSYTDTFFPSSSDLRAHTPSSLDLKTFSCKTTYNSKDLRKERGQNKT